MGGKDEKITALIGDLFDGWIKRLQETVKEAQVTGQVRSDLPANALARHIVASIEGGIMLSKLKRDGAPLKECLNSLRTLLVLKK
ncbi:MAG: TetR family transcriptional regulator C-terminal domain-containing protein [Nitrospiraceae bacterium]|nr:TetR family transcriptional regulator C-terminal domain-containing protein [Nitrospiraceae bacterium]